MDKNKNPHMPEIDVAAYREQVFGTNGQSITHPPTPINPINEASAEPKLTDTLPTSGTSATDVPKSENPPSATIPTINDEQIVDADKYLSEQLGVNSWDEAKAAFTELAQLREAAKTPAEIKYANDQSKALHEAIVAGKTDEVYEILDTQRKVAAVSSMKPAEAIKLYIQQTNKSFKAIDVDDVFEEKYTYPERPTQSDVEEDTDFKSREDKWKAAKEKIDRRIERDAETAKTELTKLSAELKLPEIPKPAVTAQANDDDEKAMKIEIAKASEYYSKLLPKDTQTVFKFNDEASKLAFDVVYEPDKDKFDNASADAADLTKLFAKFYDKDGNPDRIKLHKFIYAGENLEKIVTEAMVQAVNQERIRALKFQKNIGDTTQRNFVVQPMSDIEKLKQQVFSK